MAGVDALVLPLLASLAMELVHLTAVAALMTETRPVRPAAVGRALRSTPAIIGDAIALVRSSTVLAALVAVEFLWGFGMVAFETFTPARLSEVLQDADRAAALLGPASAAAWLLAAYLATMVVHGAANPVHQAMLHRAVLGPSTRATVISANSLTAQTGGALGGLALGALADTASLTTATLAGAAVLAFAAPLYLIAGRATQSLQPIDHRT